MPVKSRAQEQYLAIHHPEVLHKWKAEGVKTTTRGLPEHVKKHATVMDLMKAAEPDPDRDRQADDEGQMQTDKDTDYPEAGNFFGHGKGAKGKKMNTVKDLLKKKAEDTGAELGNALQGVRDNAKKTMGAVKPTPAQSVGDAKPVQSVDPAKPPGMPKKAEPDTGADLATALGKVKTDATQKVKEDKALPKAPPPQQPQVKMGPPIMPKTAGINAANSFTKMANRKDGMFFGKGAGRNDGMFMKAASDMEGEGTSTTGDLMSSNESNGAVGPAEGHGKGVKPTKKGGAEKKAQADTDTVSQDQRDPISSVAGKEKALYGHGAGVSGINEGGNFRSEDNENGHGKGIKKKADALDILKSIGSSAGQGAQGLANGAMAAGSSAAGTSADYLKTHPNAALAATAGAGYLGLKAAKKGIKGAAGGVARLFHGTPKPPPSMGERLGKALKVLRGVE